MRWIGACALAVAGCGYTSQYAAPADGRARAVWREDGVVLAPSGAAVGPRCQAEVEALVSGERTAPPPPAGGYAPTYYGPPMVVVVPGLAPPLPGPLLFSPSLALTGAAVRAGGGGPRPGLGDAGKELGAAAVYLAVVALIAMPVIDMALSLAPAESAGSSAQAIDRANALSDLLRWPGSPCDPRLPGAP